MTTVIGQNYGNLSRTLGMKSQIIQEIITGALVTGALIFLGRHIYRLLTHKKKAGCAECGVHEKN
jgi:hypothetical protein